MCLHERLFVFFKLVLNQNQVCVGVLAFSLFQAFDFNNEPNGYKIQFFNLFFKIVQL